MLKDLKDRLRNTYIENLSFEKIITKYDRDHTLHFCDPPYFETDGYENDFKEKDHLLLLNTLKSIKGKFVLTINDHPMTRKWYKDFNITETQVSYSIAKKHEARCKYKELIIKNF